MNKIKNLMPGVALCLLIAAAATGLVNFLPALEIIGAPVLELLQVLL